MPQLQCFATPTTFLTDRTIPKSRAKPPSPVELGRVRPLQNNGYNTHAPYLQLPSLLAGLDQVLVDDFEGLESVVLSVLEKMLASFRQLGHGAPSVLPASSVTIPGSCSLPVSLGELKGAVDAQPARRTLTIQTGQRKTPGMSAIPLRILPPPTPHIITFSAFHP